MTTPENWENFERIFNAALLIENESAQMKFIADETIDDETLRAAVLHLLENDRQARCFLDETVVGLGKRILAETEDKALVNREKFASYNLLEILERIGNRVKQQRKSR